MFPSSSVRLAIAVLLVAPLYGQNRVITTIAGAEWLFPGDGRPATQAALGGPLNFDIAADRNGNYYIADTDNFIIVKVGPDGIANVIAGNGLVGISGDNGIAVNAGLGQPTSVAVDGSGNIYIGDFGGRIRKVTPDGIIRTIAGTGVAGFSGDNGPALQAQIGQIYGMVLDTAGNLYFTEQDNNRVRRITPSGIISTIAGTGIAGFSGDGGPATAAQIAQPTRIVIDSSNALYFVEVSNHVVRKVANGVITTYAGKFPADQGSIADDIPATTAGLLPLAIAVDNAGVLYVTDFSGKVRRVDTNGRIRTIAGTGTNGFSGDGGPALSARFNFTLYPGLAVDSTGALLVGDNQNGRVRRITPDQRINTVAGNGLYRFSGNGGPATSASLNFPLGVMTDSAGNVYIGETLQMRIRKITPDGTISVFAGNGIQGYTGDGGPAVNASLSFPTSMAMDSKGNFYFADTVNSVIRKIDTRGIITTFAGTGFTDYNGEGLAPTQTNFAGPYGITFDDADNMLVSDTSHHALRFIPADGSEVLTFAGLLSIAGDGKPGFDGDGGLSFAALLNKPVGLTYFNDALYFCDSLNHRVRKILGSSLEISTVAGNGTKGSSGDGGLATSASLNEPVGLKFDSAGNMYIAELGGQLIRRVAPNGIISTFAGSQSATTFADGLAANNTQIGPISDLAFDRAGNLLMAASPDHRIRSVLVNPPTFQVSTNTVAFTAPSGSDAVEQTVTVNGSIPGLPFNVSLSNSAFLSVSPTNGIMPATLRIIANPGATVPGILNGTVTVNAANTIPTSIPIAVRLTATSATQASLAVKPSSMTFPFVQNAAAATRPLTVLNQGGGTLNFNLAVATSSGGTWLRTSATSGSLAAFGSTTINVTADPTRLGVGVYSGTITLTSVSPAQSVTFAVTMTISAVQQTILIPQFGLTFFAVQGGGQTLPQFFNILNTGAGQMPFTVRASTTSGGNWLAVNPSNGSSDVNSQIVPAIRVDVNPGTLGPGIYSGTVQVSAQGASNNPQFVSIFLAVLPPGSRVGPLVQPSGIIFSANAGAGDPGSQNVTVQSLSTTPVTFRAACVTEGGNWCKAVPLEGTVTPTQPLRIVVQPQVSGLVPNVYRGTLTLSFSDGTAQSVALLLVVLPSGAVVTSSEVRGATSNCTPTKLAPTFAGILGGAPAAVGFPGQILVKVVDDCSNPMTSGTVTVNFDNGDLPLSLTSVKDGGWATTWSPRNAATTVTLTATADIPELRLKGTAQARAGFVTANAPPQIGTNPLLGTGAILNAASNAIDSPVAPGSLVSIYGSGLGQGNVQNSSVPLPTTLGNASVLIAGQQAGLTFSGDTQINAQLPYETSVNTTQQALVLRGTNFSTPMGFTVAAAAPGIFTNGTPQGLVFVAEPSGRQTLADAANPAKAGDALVIYCTGLGQVNPPVPSGQAAPLTSLSSTVLPVTATIGGVSGNVFFSGLTPGFVGLYQVNVTVPAGVAPGSQVPVVITAAGQSSKPVIISVR